LSTISQHQPRRQKNFKRQQHYSRQQQHYSRQQRRSFITIVQEYERGVRLRLGSFNSVVEPGIRLNIPIFHDLWKVDIRDRMVVLNKQEVITSDNVSCQVDAAFQYRVVDAKMAVLNTTNFSENLMSRTSLAIREILGQFSVDQILQERDRLSDTIRDKLSHLEEEWGVKVAMVQLNDIVFDDTMKRAMAKEAEAERTARAKIINAKADIETAKQYSEAADVYKENPITMRLREMQLWQSVAREPGNFIAVVPSDILDMVKGKK
jgi:regulator of protease activity HflC (stomatin/prohibitin superfamily)